MTPGSARSVTNAIAFSTENLLAKLTYEALLWVCFSGTLVLGGAAAADQNLSREAVVKTALQENPTVKAARAKWEMMKARVPQASAWEDLRVGIDSTAGRFVN